MSGQQETQRTLREHLDARFRRPLMTYFLRRTNDRSEAEDLTQEAFARLLGMDIRHDLEHADGLVFTIAGNLLRDRQRRFRSRHTNAHIPIDDEVLAGLTRAAVEVLTPERVLLAKRSLEDALAALDELGQRTKDIYVLVRLENMKHREVAQLIGISSSSVEKHVIRATAHLALRFGSGHD